MLMMYAQSRELMHCTHISAGTYVVEYRLISEYHVLYKLHVTFMKCTQ